ncbi:MAG: hypothetical protein LBT47_09075, partial [Deltaproteobacteria bacterium]|nr:hypothetical protein [Deltaproteobacteria bacterium]
PHKDPKTPMQFLRQASPPGTRGEALEGHGPLSQVTPLRHVRFAHKYDIPALPRHGSITVDTGLDSSGSGMATLILAASSNYYLVIERNN